MYANAGRTRAAVLIVRILIPYPSAVAINDRTAEAKA